MTFDLKINLGHSDLYFTVRDLSSFMFCSEKHFSFIGKVQLHCPATALITVAFYFCLSLNVCEAGFSFIKCTLKKKSKVFTKLNSII